MAHFNSNSVSIIEGSTNTVIDQITEGFAPIGVAVNKLNNHIYVVNTQSNTVTIIDGATNGVLETIAVGNLPQDIAVNPNTALVYVVNRGDNSVSVIQDSEPPAQQISPPTNLEAH